MTLLKPKTLLWTFTLLSICAILLNANITYGQDHFTLIVHTGDESKAGTNANVSVGLNNQGEYVLNHRIEGDAFERGMIDTIMIPAGCNSDFINYIWVGHDDKYPGSDWFLDRIEVISPSGRRRTFTCNCWLEECKEDGGWRLLGTEPKANQEFVSNFVGKTIYIKSLIGEDNYLDVQWGNSANGTPIHLWKGNSGKAQQFIIEHAFNQSFYIRSALDGDKYLQVENCNRKSEARVVLGPKNTRQRGLWTFERLNAPNKFAIKSQFGTYLDVQWGLDKPGTPIWLWKQNFGTAQQWLITENQ